MRLTEKGLDIHKTSRYATSPEVYDLYDKLSKLEDVEDKLGIDLLTLASLVLHGCYVRDRWADKPGTISHFKFTRLSYDLNGYGFMARYGKDHDEHDFRFAQYGKTWALTKEELEGKNGKRR